MPIYEYKCEQCGHQLEILQKISEEPAKTCPECGADSLRKLVSAAAFKLKGTGWYETDFKNKKQAKDSKSDKAEVTDPQKNADKDSTKAEGSKDKSNKQKKSSNNSTASE